MPGVPVGPAPGVTVLAPGVSTVGVAVRVLVAAPPDVAVTEGVASAVVVAVRVAVAVSVGNGVGKAES